MKRLLTSVTILFFSYTLNSYAWKSDKEFTVQGVLIAGEVYVPATPPQGNLHGVPSSIMPVLYLQLPLPLGKQIQNQGITREIENNLPDLYHLPMVEIFSTDEATLKKKVGKRLKVTGTLANDLRSPQYHLPDIIPLITISKWEEISNYEGTSW